MELKLLSPVGFDPAIFYWPLPSKKGYDGARQLIETIKWACHDIPDLQIPLKRNILRNYDITTYQSIKQVCDRYNKAIKGVLRLERGTQMFCDRLNLRASRDLLQHIMQEVYIAAVENAEELNRYQAFSPDVYGETSFEMIEQMISQMKITKDDSFIDLGSGVGQVVLQMAASTSCRHCIGVERAKVPNKYAEAMSYHFEFWMNWFGKKYAKFELHQGDFFDESFRNKINESTIIFVNNFAFGPAVDHKLKERFADFKDGTRIVSSKSFCPLNFRISERNLSDIGTILRISEITPKHSSVSWTGKPVSYYLQVVDRTRLELYFQNKKDQKLQALECVLEKDGSDLEDDEYVPPSVLKSQKERLRKQQSESPKIGTPKSTNSIESFSISDLKSETLSLSSEFQESKPIKGLQELLDSFKEQYTQMVDYMETPEFRTELKQQIEREKMRNFYLRRRAAELKCEIENIIFNMRKRML